jgi:GntR family transcriptional repressor for pyruvate dehydrogenase complex
MRSGKVSRQKLSDRVVDRVKFWLMSESMKPGDRLPQEKELGELLGVSRGTVREALKALEVQGIIRVVAGRTGGAVVADVTYETAAGLLGNYFYFKQLTVQQIYDLRRILEPELAASVVGLLTHADISELKRLVASCASTEDTPEARRRQRLDELEFHTVLARRAPNPLISFNCQFINRMLAEQVVVKRMYLERQERIDQENHDSHSELIQAYEAKDAERVMKIMTRHMCDCSHHVVEMGAVVRQRFLTGDPGVLSQDLME